jgi:hypothetical protein
LRAASGSSGGTFVVRENAPVNKILNCTPGARAKVTDMFSPMKLQRLFNPPTPEVDKQPRNSDSDEEGAEDQPLRPVSRFTSSTTQVEDNLDDFCDQDFVGEISLSDVDSGSGTHRSFIANDQQEERDLIDFASPNTSNRSNHSLVVKPREQFPVEPLSSPSDEILETDIPNLGGFDGRQPRQAFQFTFNVPRENLGTPTSARVQQQIPSTDPRLRLFHFQYDTYTHEHLSNLVDAISAPGTDAHVRSTKRLRLSPPVDTPIPPRNQPRRNTRDGARHFVHRPRSFVSAVGAAGSPLTVAVRHDEDEAELDEASLEGAHVELANNFWRLTVSVRPRPGIPVPRCCPERERQTLCIHLIGNTR